MKPLPAVPPPTPTTTTPPPTPAPAPAGRFAVLKDDKLIEGTVTVVGEKVIVRQGVLDRPFPKADVQFVGNSKDEVYRFMVGKAPPTDAAARLKVAKWCMFNGMRSHALAEAREVVKLDPKNAAAAQMVRALEESLQKFPEEGAAQVPAAPAAAPTNPTGPALPPVPPPMTAAPPMIPPAIPPAVIPAAAVEPEPEVTPESATQFGTRVQPILANLCAECHAKADHASAFKLARTTDYDTGPQTARPNLKAVAAQLNKDDPDKSPLLVKALTAHGGMKEPPLAGRHLAAYRSLEGWVFAAVGAAPPPPAPEPIARTVPSNPGPILPPAGATAPAAPAAPQPVSPVLPPPVVGSFGQDAKPLTPDPAGTGEPADEFDPSVFNRTVHPGRK
ncbi:MAG TPA: hypothetical protein VKE74_27985 [Gemmataceae bacterium]|nr:hypothetical protein [Gemmataceae bacterium]